MVPARADEIEERAARLRAASGNGQSPAHPDPDDLDWFLFHSFPGSDVEPARLVALLPHYERALARGASFDFELLYVRALEVGARASDDLRAAIARAAAERVLAGAFDAADAIAAIRFAIRVLPDDELVTRVVSDANQAKLRFDLTLDFLLDERELDDYLAISYLREGDPDADPVLARFPAREDAKRRLAALFEETACRRRVEEGWARWTEPAERPTLRAALRDRWPDFAATD
jgi:hypothetical protein